MRERQLWIIAAAIAVLGTGCDGTKPETEAGERGNADATRLPGAGADGGNSASAAANTDLSDAYVTHAEYCGGSGPPIVVLDTGDEQRNECVGRIAQVAFRYAFCSCADYSGSVLLTTDSFDSSQGPYSASTAGRAGSVGVNGSIRNSGPMSIGGSLFVAPGGISGTGSVSVASGLGSNGDLTKNGPVAVGGDAEVNGDVTVDDLSVAGTLTLPAGGTLKARSTDIAQQRIGPVSVSVPCDCAEEGLYDIGALVRRYATLNDNVAGGFDRSALQQIAQDTTLEIPCGRFYLEGIGAASRHVTLRVTGRAALFVGGDLNLSDGLTVELAPSAELDLFVEGLVRGAGTLNLGSRDAPARTRLYVGGTGTIGLSKTQTFSGNLYAPRAKLSGASEIEVFGSVFVDGLSKSSSITVHYDQSILEAAKDCDIPPGDCKDCRDCGNQACVDGQCGACRESSDCCAPLVCDDGTCVPYLGLL